MSLGSPSSHSASSGIGAWLGTPIGSQRAATAPLSTSASEVVLDALLARQCVEFVVVGVVLRRDVRQQRHQHQRRARQPPAPPPVIARQQQPAAEARAAEHAQQRPGRNA